MSFPKAFGALRAGWFVVHPVKYPMCFSRATFGPFSGKTGTWQGFVPLAPFPGAWCWCQSSVVPGLEQGTGPQGAEGHFGVCLVGDPWLCPPCGPREAAGWGRAEMLCFPAAQSRENEAPKSNLLLAALPVDFFSLPTTPEMFTHRSQRSQALQTQPKGQEGLSHRPAMSHRRELPLLQESTPGQPQPRSPGRGKTTPRFSPLSPGISQP